MRKLEILIKVKLQSTKTEAFMAGYSNLGNELTIICI